MSFSDMRSVYMSLLERQDVVTAASLHHDHITDTPERSSGRYKHKRSAQFPLQKLWREDARLQSEELQWVLIRNEPRLKDVYTLQKESVVEFIS